MKSQFEHNEDRVVLISPVRNEATYLPGFASCLLAQTVKPVQWVIVDDGSTDGTSLLSDELAREHPWITVVHLQDRGYRHVGGGVVRAFQAGLASVDRAYDFVGKVDADLTFGATYLEVILGRFRCNPRLGSASGKVFRPEEHRLVEEFMIDDMVAGQFKLYRRQCFEDIGGLVPEVLWDGIDYHRARQRGWETRSFPDDALRLMHHRLMGSSDRSVYRGRLRLGYGQWFMGSHPFYVLASSVFRMMERPYVVGGFLIFLGFLKAAWNRVPRFPDLEFRRELRSWQRQRLKRLLLKGRIR
ncbi:MAG TPA: glycosyltransferase family A protein [Planctomycetota bacterium]|nr:glycosyltransferase family A protein [Planctomycetota bacterium]